MAGVPLRRRVFIKTEAVARLVLWASTCAAFFLWLYTRQTDDIPGENFWSFWFLAAIPFLVEAAVRLRHSRFLALGGAFLIVGFLSRALSTLAGYVGGITNLPINRVVIIMVSWSLMSLYAAVIFYVIAHTVVDGTRGVNHR